MFNFFTIACSVFSLFAGKQSSYELEDRRPEEDEYYQEWSELEPELGGPRDKKAPSGTMASLGLLCFRPTLF